MADVNLAGQRVLPLMPALLIDGTVPASGAGTQLYVLSAHTTRYFA